MTGETRRDLSIRQTVNNADLTRLEGLKDHNLRRDLSLRIRKNGDKLLFFACSSQGDFFPTGDGKVWEAECALAKEDVFQYAQSCRKVWQQTLVDGPKAFEVRSDPRLGCDENHYFFQQDWDFSAQPEVLQERAGKLAAAGQDLFYLLFEESSDRHPQELRDLGAELKRASRSRNLVMTITSDCFFVPWNLIYVHPDSEHELQADGANFAWEGFWGYRHIIEHNPEQVPVRSQLLTDGGSRKLRFSANVDENIDTALKVDCVRPLIAFFQSQPRLESVVRTTKDQLGAAFHDREFADRILFFCCHGRVSLADGQTSVEVPALQLTDPETISAQDLKVWLKNHQGVLPNFPFVFINACQGGQMTNLFYTDLAAEFLKKKAAGLVGSQIDIPAVFACQYALKFFEKLLDNRNGPVLVGRLLRELAQEFVDTYHNPLGLAYSLYRGADCYVADPE